MNKYQRIVLIGTGLVIAAFQLYGLAEYGLDQSNGWPLSFLISAALLFVGFGSWQGLGNILNRRQSAPYVDSPPPATTASTIKLPEAPTQERKPAKQEFGIHISELDIAIEAHKNYAQMTKLDGPLEGNGRTLNWNCCVSVYASMRYAARKTEMRIHGSIWNTIIHAIVVRMTTEEVEGVGMGDPGYKQLESDAYVDIERINGAVDSALSGKGTYAVEPIVNVLTIMFGARGEGIKALTAMVMMNAEKARQKILPELLADLS